jgi:multidrug efflux pump subunit AcrB
MDPATGTQYNVTTQTPQYRLNTLNDLAATPLRPAGTQSSQLLSNVALFHRSAASGVVSHYNAMPVIDIYGSVQGADLGFMSAQVNQAIASSKHDLPRGAQVFVRGQVQTMNASFNGLLVGLLGAIVLVYLLMVVNFQSWLDPFIIITALPAALAGIVWMLFLTHTTVSVPALTGAIMCMGVATANSVLIVSFARERINAGDDAFSAASQAGFARFRPVLMTALAMIIGMVPMALGLGEGGEQNAPLGRAVIGGLVFATVATLLFVPTVFRLIHGRRHAPATA